jgi:hypothetical protein
MEKQHPHSIILTLLANTIKNLNLFINQALQRQGTNHGIDTGSITFVGLGYRDRENIQKPSKCIF